MTGPMVLGLDLGNGFGPHAGAWRMPDVDPSSYSDFSVTVRQAQAAEAAGFHFAFFPERMFLHGDLSSGPPFFNIDPLMTMAALTSVTSRIGLISTASTSFNEPYLLARQLKTLDVFSHGRIGWNAVPSYEAQAFANFGRPLPPSEQKYERLHESMQVIYGLWGSWGKEAGQPDQKTGVFANPAHVRPVNLQGKHVGSRGPLPVPPSEQGQPVVVMPLGSGYGLEAAALYANAVLAMPATIEHALEQRELVNRAVERAGRDPKDVRFMAFIRVEAADTQREAVDFMRSLDDRRDLRHPLAQLGALLGIHITRPDEPFTAQQLAALRPTHPQAERAVQYAREGWTPKEVVALGVLEPIPVMVDSGEQGADFLQAWHEAGAADVLVVSFSSYKHGIENFAQKVIPILRERGLFLGAEEGVTLRDALGLPTQYGLDAHSVK